MSLEPIIEQIKKLSVADLVKLTDELAKSLGVDKAMLESGPAPHDIEQVGEQAISGKTAFDVKIKSYGDSKLAVIKVIKEKLGISLVQAKSIVESCIDGKLTVVATGLSRDEAEVFKKDLADAGADAIYE
jgi:large subunit ribosomal protein L7/L12